MALNAFVPIFHFTNLINLHMSTKMEKLPPAPQIFFLANSLSIINLVTASLGFIDSYSQKRAMYIVYNSWRVYY